MIVHLLLHLRAPRSEIERRMWTRNVGGGNENGGGEKEKIRQLLGEKGKKRSRIFVSMNVGKPKLAS